MVIWAALKSYTRKLLKPSYLQFALNTQTEISKTS